jgi:hypothetical protein
MGHASIMQRKGLTVALSVILTFALVFVGSMPLRASATGEGEANDLDAVVLCDATCKDVEHLHVEDAAADTVADSDVHPCACDTCEVAADDCICEGGVEGRAEGQCTDACVDCEPCTDETGCCPTEAEPEGTFEEVTELEAEEDVEVLSESWQSEMYVGGSINNEKKGDTSDPYSIPKDYTYPVVCYKNHTHKTITYKTTTGSFNENYQVVYDDGNGTAWIRGTKASGDSVHQASCGTYSIKFKVTDDSATSKVSVITNGSNTELFYFEYDGTNANSADKLMPLPVGQSLSLGNFSSSSKSTGSNYGLLFIKSDNSRLITSLAGSVTGSTNTTIKWCACTTGNGGLANSSDFATIWQKAQEKGAIAHSHVELSSAANTTVQIMPTVQNSSPSMSVDINHSISSGKDKYQEGDEITFTYTVKKSDSIGSTNDKTLEITPTVTTDLGGKTEQKTLTKQSSGFTWTETCKYTVTADDINKKSISLKVSVTANYEYKLKTHTSYQCSINSTSSTSVQKSNTANQDDLYSLTYNTSVEGAESVVQELANPTDVTKVYNGREATVDQKFDSSKYYVDSEGKVWQFSGWKKDGELFTNDKITLTENVTLTGEWICSNDQSISYESWTYNRESADTAKAISSLGTVAPDKQADSITFHAGSTASRANQLAEAPRDPGTYIVKGTWTLTDAANLKNDKTVEVTSTFTISKIPLSDVTFEGLTDKTYTGAALEQDLVADYKGTTITKDCSYVVTYENNTAVGTATVKIVGIDKFEGERTLTFSIDKIKMSDLEIGELEDAIYTGSEIIPDLDISYAGDLADFEQPTYTVTIENNIDVGTARVIIAGDGNFEGEVVRTFKITPARLTESMFEQLADTVYNGLEHIQEIIGEGVAGEPLVEGEHYTDVKWFNNMNASSDDAKAGVSFSGTGNYEGDVTLGFSIARATGNGVKDPGSLDKVYDGEDVDLGLEAEKEGSTIWWKDPVTGEWSTTPPSIKDPGSYTVEVKVEHPNYETVETEISFTISPVPESIAPEGDVDDVGSGNKYEGAGGAGSTGTSGVIGALGSTSSAESTGGTDATGTSQSAGSNAEAATTQTESSAAGNTLATTGDMLWKLALGAAAIALVSCLTLMLARKRRD